MQMFALLLTLILLLFPSVWLVQTSGSKSQPELVTICEVLGNRSSYNGKVVALIGRWSATDEGFWLTDECDRQIKTGDYVWSNIIFLSYDPSAPSIFLQPNKSDKVAMSKRLVELKARSKLSDDKVEWAVVYGRVETKEELSTVVGDKTSVWAAGYGHLNAAPAQIVYREKDLIILARDGR
jgi:hypothetical protein